MWDTSNRRSRLPANWPALRSKRLKLDDYRCTWRLPSGARCPRKATDVDHRIAMTDDDRIEALQSLCAHHHSQKSSLEGRRAAAKRKASRFRPREEHPSGL